MNLKEWSFIILMICLIIVVVAFAVVFVIAIMNTLSAEDGSLLLSGTIDISQVTTIVFGIALIATVLVSQKLTQQAVQSAVKQTDDTWLETEKKE